ncbi:SDR family NAD(P)-dependent oxidoreductase, partial [Desulforhopalus vacuolatus]
MRKILITGAAGFIGHGLALRLLAEGRDVIGLDNLNEYYDPQLKQDRLSQLQAHDRFRHVQFDMAERDRTADLFVAEQFDAVVNLAAQAGVRYSLVNPHAYV